ncbi:Protein Thf1 [Dillenia turbinata]|uniref:Protein Thf1 n=1 Tax=Dillenia turbinata TaxID=194707 RepID=A0AAN8UVU5_9MAGN
MASVSTLSLTSSLGAQSSERRVSISSTRLFASGFESFRLRTCFAYDSASVRTSNSNSNSRFVVQCMSSSTGAFCIQWCFGVKRGCEVPLMELIVQQHLMRYKRTYCYDAVFALGFVTVYDQLMEGYPSDEDRDTIFQAYIKALKEDPEQYRSDAKKLEEWARAQNASTLVDFSSREGEVEGILKDIAKRARAKGSFSYSRFFAIGLFRLLELANATEPTILEKLCTALNIDKRSVDRDLDVYRNLLSKLVQAKELLKEYVDREKKKREERAESQKANEAITKCLAEYEYTRQ